MTSAFTPHIPFALDPMWVSMTVLAVTYAFIIAGRLNRAVVALIGAAVVIIVGALALTLARIRFVPSFTLPPGFRSGVTLQKL